MPFCAVCRIPWLCCRSGRRRLSCCDVSNRQERQKQYLAHLLKLRPLAPFCSSQKLTALPLIRPLDQAVLLRHFKSSHNYEIKQAQLSFDAALAEDLNVAASTTVQSFAHAVVQVTTSIQDSARSALIRCYPAEICLGSVQTLASI